VKNQLTIIGGGIVGLATALKAVERWPGLRVQVLEKEQSVGCHQSTHNSGVLHAGLYYKPGSYKARLAVQGIRKMKAFCEVHSVAHEVCGKLVVATTPEEVGRLDSLFQRGVANGLEGLRRLGKDEMREVEPHVAGLEAVHVPEEGIVDYRGVCDSMAKELTKRGAEIRCGYKVNNLVRDGSSWIVESSNGEIHTPLIINAAGLYCDRISRLSGAKVSEQIIPFRGEYYKLKRDWQYLVKHLIYPVPDPSFPFLGVHFTRLIHGGIEAGPNAVLAFAREGYTFGKINPSELFESLTFPGLWKFMRQHSQMCYAEVRQSLSRRLFCKALQKLVPEVEESALEPGGSGVRAQAMSRDGALVQDFAFNEAPGILHVLNAPSPGATASLAIGEEIVGRFEQQITT